MERIDRTLFNEHWSTIHPKGEAALQLYTLVMSVCSGSVLDLLEEGGARNHSRAAFTLAGVPGAFDVVVRTFKGATINGVELDRKGMVERFSKPGNMVKPYIAALIVWGEMGFFSVSVDKEEPRRSDGVDQPGRG